MDRRVGNVAHAVDVARRRETAYVADVVLISAEQVQLGVEALLVLDALYDARTHQVTWSWMRVF
jgi:hypothetical protein